MCISPERIAKPLNLALHCDVVAVSAMALHLIPCNKGLANTLTAFGDKAVAESAMVSFLELLNVCLEDTGKAIVYVADELNPGLIETFFVRNKP